MGDAHLGPLPWSCVPSFASSRRHVMTMYMVSDSSVSLQYECIYILLAYMYTLPCSICMLSLFLLLSENSCDQLMLFVLLYPTQNKAYVMLCYVMLCYVMLCYVMLCYVMLCYVMLCYVMLCYVMLCYVMLCYVMLCYVMLCYVMLCYVMLCYVMLCYVMLCYVMLCYVMLCYVKYQLNT